MARLTPLEKLEERRKEYEEVPESTYITDAGAKIHIYAKKGRSIQDSVPHVQKAIKLGSERTWEAVRSGRRTAEEAAAEVKRHCPDWQEKYIEE